MGPNQTKFISMGPIWNTSGTEMEINGLGPKWAVFQKKRIYFYFKYKVERDERYLQAVSTSMMQGTQRNNLI